MNDPSSPGAPTDQALVKRALEGDSRAMDELVARHHGSVFRVALGILRDEDQAADVAQDAFLKAFRGMGKFRGDSSFKTWLLAITVNEAKGALRKTTRRRETPLEAAAPVPSGEATPEQRLQNHQEKERVTAILRELPEKQRLAVTMRIFEGMSFREVGAAIGSSEGAARVNYHHGIRRLRERLG